MSFVLDSSVAIAWQMPHEGSSALSALFDHFLDVGADVPVLWRLEVANILLIAERRGRIDAAFRKGSLADFAALPIRVDTETDNRAWRETLDLAERHGLTVYDACYLELAHRLNRPLATLDKELRTAAVAAGIGLSAV